MLGSSDASASNAYTVRVSQAEQQRTKAKPSTIHHAAEQGNIEELKKYLQDGLAFGTPESVTLQQKEEVLGMMPVHIAAEKGQVDCMEFLIKKRVDLDAGDNFRATALHLAAIEDHYEIARLLLAAKANPNLPDSEGDMPIHWAATKGHTDIIELLLSHKSPVDPVNKHSWTPLHRAAYNGRRRAVEALVKAGASLRAVTKEGNTALHLACFMNQLSTVETLLGLTARTDVVNGRGQTPRDLCITDAAREMMEAVGAPTAADLPGGGAAAAAAKAGEAGRPAATAQQPATVGAVQQRIADMSLNNGSRRNRGDDFPDFDAQTSIAARAGATGPQGAGEEEAGLLYRSGATASNLLQEASQAYAMLSGSGNSPYSRRG